MTYFYGVGPMTYFSSDKTVGIFAEKWEPSPYFPGFDIYFQLD